jgi:ribosomal protein S21
VVFRNRYIAVFFIYAILTITMINVEIEKKTNENVGGLLRRFSRRSQSAGTMKRVRSIRYHARKLSSNRTKKDALNRLTRIKEYTNLWKLGREPVKKGRSK